MSNPILGTVYVNITDINLFLEALEVYKSTLEKQKNVDKNILHTNNTLLLTTNSESVFEMVNDSSESCKDNIDGINHQLTYINETIIKLEELNDYLLKVNK